eukprot:PhM_4_TR15967/c3_g1_i1/m.45721
MRCAVSRIFMQSECFDVLGGQFPILDGDTLGNLGGVKVRVDVLALGSEISVAALDVFRQGRELLLEGTHDRRRELLLCQAVEEAVLEGAQDVVRLGAQNLHHCDLDEALVLQVRHVGGELRVGHVLAGLTRRELRGLDAERRGHVGHETHVVKLTVIDSGVAGAGVEDHHREEKRKIVAAGELAGALLQRHALEAAALLGLAVSRHLRHPGLELSVGVERLGRGVARRDHAGGVRVDDLPQLEGVVAPVVAGDLLDAAALNAVGDVEALPVPVGQERRQETVLAVEANGHDRRHGARRVDELLSGVVVDVDRVEKVRLHHHGDGVAVGEVAAHRNVRGLHEDVRGTKVGADLVLVGVGRLDVELRGQPHVGLVHGGEEPRALGTLELDRKGLELVLLSVDEEEGDGLLEAALRWVADDLEQVVEVADVEAASLVQAVNRLALWQHTLNGFVGKVRGDFGQTAHERRVHAVEALAREAVVRLPHVHQRWDVRGAPLERRAVGDHKDVGVVLEGVLVAEVVQKLVDQTAGAEGGLEAKRIEGDGLLALGRLVRDLARGDVRHVRGDHIAVVVPRVVDAALVDLSAALARVGVVLGEEKRRLRSGESSVRSGGSSSSRGGARFLVLARVVRFRRLAAHF